jgi:hypothetical protein
MKTNLQRSTVRMLKPIALAMLWLGLMPTGLRADPLDHWTNRISATLSNLNSITYGSNQFAAVGSGGTILTSTNGADWTSRASGTTTGLYGIAYGNNQFAAVGDSGAIVTSPDGTNWTSRASGTVSNLNSIVWGKNSFVAVGEGGTILQSGVVQPLLGPVGFLAGGAARVG